MMFKSLFTLLLLFADVTLGITKAIPKDTTLSSETTINSNTTPKLQTSLDPKATSNPMATKNTEVTSTIATTMSTRSVATTKNMENGGTKLNPMDSTHVLFYVIFLLFFVHLG